MAQPDGSRCAANNHQRHLAAPDCLTSPTKPFANTGGEDNRGSGGGGGRRGGFGGGDYASPIIADGKIYHLTRGGDMHVFAVANEFKPIAVNRVTSETEDFSATPAVSDGAIYIRSNKHLYCVARLSEP